MAGLFAIFGTVRELPAVEALGELAEGEAPEVEQVEAGEPGWARVEVRWPDATLVLSRMGPVGQRRALSAVVLRATQGKLTPRGAAVLQRVAGTRHVVGFATPGEEPASPAALARAESFARRLARALNGLVYRGGAVLDPALRVLLGGEGDPDPEAAVPCLPESLERRARSRERLAMLNISAPELPPLPATAEVCLRAPVEVARRVQALWAVVARAEGMERQDAIDLLQKRELWQAATPAEHEFLLEGEHEEPELQTRRERVAALHALLWALGKAEFLGPPTRPVSLDECTQVLRKHAAEWFLKNAALRPVEEVLDEACVAWLCHGAAAAALREGREVPGGMLPAVARERHVALLWLIGFMNHSWDELTGESLSEPD